MNVTPPIPYIYAMVKTWRIWIMVTPPLLEIRMSSISSLLMLVLPSLNMINIGILYIYMYIPMIYSYIMLHIMAMALMPSVYPSWTCWWPTPSKPPQLTTSPSSRRAAKATRDATMRRTFTSCSWRPDDHDPWRVRAQPISTQWPKDKLWGRFSGADSACFKHLQTISYIYTHTHIYIYSTKFYKYNIFEKGIWWYMYIENMFLFF